MKNPFNWNYCKLVKVRTLCILCNNWSLFVPREMTPVLAWRPFKHLGSSFLAQIRYTVLYILTETKRQNSWVYLYNKIIRSISENLKIVNKTIKLNEYLPTIIGLFLHFHWFLNGITVFFFIGKNDWSETTKNWSNMVKIRCF